MGKLTTRAVAAAMKVPGRYGDGDGLYLEVSKAGSASWIVRIQKNGRRRDFGLGSAKKVPLALARERAAFTRSQVEAGLDPARERKKDAEIPTFRAAASKVHSEHRKAWRNAKHRDQWLSSLEQYAFPVIGDKKVSEIEASHVRDLLAEIWLSKNETARRVRQRIATVIDWAVGKGYRPASLPMQVINRALPKPPAKERHHPALACVRFEVAARTSAARDVDHARFISEVEWIVEKW